jgi:hypothetical protein
MAWRHASGATIMCLGACVVLATIAGATVLGVSFVKSGELPVAPPLFAMSAAGGIAGGVIAMVLGRLVYGRWREAAPVANFTADVARMIGLSVAAGLGVMLVFLLVTGFKPEDLMAALVLGVGTVAGLFLAFIGSNLRRSSRRYLD